MEQEDKPSISTISDTKSESGHEPACIQKEEPERENIDADSRITSFPEHSFSITDERIIQIIKSGFLKNSEENSDFMEELDNVNSLFMYSLKQYVKEFDDNLEDLKTKIKTRLQKWPISQDDTVDVNEESKDLAFELSSYLEDLWLKIVEHRNFVSIAKIMKPFNTAECQYFVNLTARQSKLQHKIKMVNDRLEKGAHPPK